MAVIVTIFAYGLQLGALLFLPALLFIEKDHQKKGLGSRLMTHWERDMKAQGYGMLLTSTQVDEEAQHFYRKLGYKDCGGFVIDLPGFAQPMELFLIKGI